jgi:hypothetical protein
MPSVAREELDKERWKYFSQRELEVLQGALNDCGNEFRLTDQGEAMAEQIEEAIEELE